MFRHSCTLVGAIALLAFMAGPALALTYVPYYITDLGTLGDSTWVMANSINNSGQVSGKTYNSDGTGGGFMWSGGAMTDLGTPGFAVESFMDCHINDSGVVAGTIISDTYEYYSFVWKSGTMSLMLGGTGTETVTHGINQYGVMVGSERDTQHNQAFLFSGGSFSGGTFTGGTYTDIGTPLGFDISSAVAINKHGLVGCNGNYDTTVSGGHTPFLYDSSTGSTTMLKTSIPYAMSVTDVNDNKLVLIKGDVVGGTETYPSRGYLYDGTTTVDIGVFAGHTETTPYDLNNNDQVVGSCFIPCATKAFLYDAPTADLIDLNERLGPDAQAYWTVLQNAQAINDSGQIVGQGITSDGYNRSYIMMPALSGDANIDGSVNGTDLNTVLSNYNATISGDNKTRWLAGDFNVDGSVNGTDLNTVLSNYNQSVSFSSAAVPEPSTLLLMVLGLLGYVAWRKRFGIC